MKEVLLVPLLVRIVSMNLCFREAQHPVGLYKISVHTGHALADLE